MTTCQIAKYRGSPSGPKSLLTIAGPGGRERGGSVRLDRTLFSAGEGNGSGKVDFHRATYEVTWQRSPQSGYTGVLQAEYPCHLFFYTFGLILNDNYAKATNHNSSSTNRTAKIFNLIGCYALLYFTFVLQTVSLHEHAMWCLMRSD